MSRASTSIDRPCAAACLAGVVAADLAGGRVVHVHAIDDHDKLPVARPYPDIRLAEDGEQVEEISRLMPL